MATNWPNSVQTFTNPTAGSALNSPSHADQHITVNDTVEALQNYAGLVLVKSQTIGTGVSSVTVTDAFSATFDNYRVLISFNGASVDTAFNLRLGSATTNYYYNTRRFEWSGGVATSSGSSISEFRIGSTYTASGGQANVDIMRPYESRVTTFTGFGQYLNTSASGGTFVGGGMQNTTTSFTAFTVFPSSGTISNGTIRVYGYNNG